MKILENIDNVKEFNELYDAVGWGSYEEEISKKALSNNIYSVSIYDNNNIIGYGRIIGDGIVFLYIHDIMVKPEYQGKGIGKTIMNKRNNTKKVKIGDIYIGGGSPVAIQSMTNTSTEDVTATVAQIQRLEKKGCEIIRVAVPTPAAAEALKDIKKRIHIPLVADMSSCILSEEIDVSKFGLIFAGAQKNVGPAGMTIVIMREDLIGFAGETVPTYLDYKIHAKNDSMYNTPPCFAIYIAGLVFKRIKEMGGLAAMHAADVEKAEMLYNCIDQSKLFKCPVAKEDRSLMNVVFVTGDGDLDKKFVSDAKAAGMINLNGHRSVGGMRASIYNAMPKEGVAQLVAFMQKFEEENL